MKARYDSLGSPYRVRAVVRTFPARWLGADEWLDSAVVIAQIAVLLLCVARAGVDLARGAMSVEGVIAFVILTAVGLSLVAKAGQWARRSVAAHPPEYDEPPLASGRGNDPPRARSHGRRSRAR